MLWVEREMNQVTAGIMMLEGKMNIIVVRAENFSEAWEIFNKESFVAILMEPNFPGQHEGRYENLNREEICVQFVRDVKNIQPDIPFILISTITSNWPTEKQFLSYKELGCNFLYKPYLLEELEIIIKKVLN